MRTRCDYVGLTGYVSGETIQRYIEEQQGRWVLGTYKYRLYPTPEQKRAWSDILQAG